MITITSNITDDINELKLVGRLDVKAAREAEEAFATACDETPNIVLDMSELDYIASAGLRSIKRLRGAVKENGGTLVLRGVQDEIMEIFEMTGFAAMLTFE